MDDECVEELGRPISSLKVAELRDELTKRSQIRTGNKKELIDRLRITIQRQSSSQSNESESIMQQQYQQLQDVVQQQQFQQLQDVVQQQQYQQLQDVVQQQYQQLQDVVQQQQYQQLQDVVQQQQLQDVLQQQQNQQLQDVVQQNQQLQDVQQQQQQQQQNPQSQDVVPQQQNQQSQDDVLQQQQSPQSQDVVPQQQNPQSQDDVLQQQQLLQKPQYINAPATTTHESKDGQTPSETLKETEPEPEIPSKSKDDAQTEEIFRSEEKSTNDSAKDCDIEISVPSSSISLKRSISQKSDLGGKEKRRKWSTKTSTESIQAVDSSQVSIESTSSKQTEDSSKSTSNEEQISKDSAEPILQVNDAELEDGQLADSSIESKSSEKMSQNEKQNEKEVINKTIETNKKLNEKETPVPPKPEVEAEPSNILLVQNLVRPFTLTQLKEVLTKHGPIDEEKFWTDKVKSKCCVMYESIEVAKLTKESLHGQQWPSSNPKTLKVTYTTQDNLNQFLKMDLAKPANKNRTFAGGENGSNISDSTGKSITERLGQKLPETGDEPTGSDQVKKRLGDKLPSDVGTKSSTVKEADNSKPQELDDLFKKTKSVPHLFWLPLTESEADVRQKERDKREARAKELAKKRRSPPRRRSPIRHRSPMRHRSPPGRRSPIRNRSRSPVYRRSPPRPRSPMLRRSPIRRRSPPGRSSPPRRRSPGHVRRSPPHHRSPLRSPIPRSLGRSPPLRRSPGPIRRSPGLTRRSPITMRRSPQLLRRSPLPMRGNSPLINRGTPPRKRSPLRRTPPRHMSPGRNMGGYPNEQRRPERLDRLR